MFKEYIAKDIDTFINLDEFSEMVNINGTEVPVVEDHEKLEYKIKKDYDGLIIGDVLFYIKFDECRKIRNMNPPKSNVAISYKGIPSVITSVAEDMGIYEIILQRNGR